MVMVDDSHAVGFIGKQGRGTHELHGVMIASDTGGFFDAIYFARSCPRGGSSMLFPALVGYQRAAKIFLTGEEFSPQYAREIGLVAEVVADAEKEAIAIAKIIADQPPQAVLNTKALMKASKHDAVEAVMKAEFQIFSLALQSEEFADAAMKKMSSKKGK